MQNPQPVVTHSVVPVLMAHAAHAKLRGGGATASSRHARISRESPRAEDYKRIGGGLWIITAWLLRNDLEKLKSAYINDHASFSVVAALLLTISTALSMLAPGNSADGASFAFGSSYAIHYVFSVSTSLCIACNIMTILLAAEMMLAANTVPAAAIHWYLIENTHKGPTREPSFWAIGSYVCLCVSLTTCSILQNGGLHWVALCAAYVGVVAVYFISAPSRWESVLRSMLHVCNDETDVELLNFNASIFPPTAMWMWWTQREPFVFHGRDNAANA
jgi:hypothetical protein